MQHSPTSLPASEGSIDWKTPPAILKGREQGSDHFVGPCLSRTECHRNDSDQQTKRNTSENVAEAWYLNNCRSYLSSLMGWMNLVLGIAFLFFLYVTGYFIQEEIWDARMNLSIGACTDRSKFLAIDHAQSTLWVISLLCFVPWAEISWNRESENKRKQLSDSSPSLISKGP